MGLVTDQRRRISAALMALIVRLILIIIIIGVIPSKSQTLFDRGRVPLFSFTFGDLLVQKCSLSTLTYEVLC